MKLADLKDEQRVVVMVVKMAVWKVAEMVVQMVAYLVEKLADLWDMR
jgi:hypothetical protein